MSIFEDQFASMRVSNWNNFSILANLKHSSKDENSNSESLINKLIKRFLLVAGITIFSTSASNALSTSAEIISSRENIVVSENFLPSGFSLSAPTTMNYGLSVGNVQSVDFVKVDHLDSVEHHSDLNAPVFEVEKASPIVVAEQLSKNTLESVTEHGAERIKHFASLEDGWDNGHGAALKSESVKAFDRFFATGELQVKDLSVFMSSDGNLIANWLLNEDTTVELEFEKDLIHYFNEASGDEYSVARRGAGDFKSYLKRNASNV